MVFWKRSFGHARRETVKLSVSTADDSLAAPQSHTLLFLFRSLLPTSCSRPLAAFAGPCSPSSDPRSIPLPSPPSRHQVYRSHLAWERTRRNPYPRRRTLRSRPAPPWVSPRVIHSGLSRQGEVLPQRCPAKTIRQEEGWVNRVLLRL